MTRSIDIDRILDGWLSEGPSQIPDRVIASITADIQHAAPKRRWRPAWRNHTYRNFFALAGAAVLVVVGALALNFYANRQGIGVSPSPSPSASPIAGASPSVEPTASSLSARCPSPRGAGTVLDCSSDGTRLLIQKDYENLFVVHADRSETQVTDQLSGFKDIGGSARPAGATISPDGSRVVFAGLTKTGGERRSCHDGALFAVDADGGPAELLWESQVPQNGIVRYPTFSPDGTQIAFADGYCDHDHSVWVMNADGTDAHQIVSNETTLGAGHVYGLAWSAAGDRIALSIDFAGTFTFLTDGSDFTRVAGAAEYCWPGRQC